MFKLLVLFIVTHNVNFERYSLADHYDVNRSRYIMVNIYFEICLNNHVSRSLQLGETVCVAMYPLRELATRMASLSQDILT